VSDEILVEQRDRVATVVFNRPRMRNAISFAMWGEIAEVTERLAKDDAVRAIVYRGAGREAFASGADISEFEEHRKDAASAATYGQGVESAYQAIRRCPKPTVAMIHGYCMGGAMGIAMACDLRFAAQGSRYGIPAARLSVVYGLDAVHQLVALVGPAYAQDILFSARTLDADEALRIGFIQRLLPADALEGETYAYLARVADNAPLSIQGTKAQVQALFEGLTDAHRARLRQLSAEASVSADHREGTRAFMEKRAPRFEGR